MKSFVCIVLLAAAALAAPEGKRDKRGYLLGGYDHGHSLIDHSHSLLDHSHGFIDHSHGFIDHGHGLGYDAHFDHAHIIAHAPAKIVSVNKIVEVPKIVEVKKLVSVPKVVSVPQVVKVAKYIEEPHISYSSGWW